MMFALGLFLACGSTPAPAEAPPASPATAEEAPPHTADPASHPALADADAADGTVDKVVSRCPACGLGMDGDPAHASQIGEYTLHSCSASCKEGLEADPNAVLARLEGIGKD